MADHFYSIAGASQTSRRYAPDIVVGTSLTAGNPIELRVTDGQLTARQVYNFCEYLADLFARRESNQVVAAGSLKG